MRDYRWSGGLPVAGLCEASKCSEGVEAENGTAYEGWEVGWKGEMNVKCPQVARVSNEGENVNDKSDGWVNTEHAWSKHM